LNLINAFAWGIVSSAAQILFNPESVIQIAYLWRNRPIVNGVSPARGVAQTPLAAF
jgi:hypothetical protein